MYIRVMLTGAKEENFSRPMVWTDDLRSQHTFGCSITLKHRLSPPRNPGLASLAFP